MDPFQIVEPDPSVRCQVWQRRYETTSHDQSAEVVSHGAPIGLLNRRILKALFTAELRAMKLILVGNEIP